jgi:hypothetical protein
LRGEEAQPIVVETAHHVKREQDACRFVAPPVARLLPPGPVSRRRSVRLRRR